MGKKRKTRQQKIISKLRRELSQQRVVSVNPLNRKAKLTPARHQPVRDPRRNAGIRPIKAANAVKTIRKSKTPRTIFAYNPKLIKKDLIKTLLLSFIFLGIIFILKFFRLGELLFHQ